MNKQIALLCLSSLVALAPAVPAANITWISDQVLDASSQLPDQGYINLLTAAGHTVTRALAATPSAAALNSANLVILGRSGASASFDTAAETLVWNTQVTVPLISTNSYFSRSTRLGWFTGSTQPDQTLNPLTFTAGAVSDYIKGSSTGASVTEAVIFPDASVDIRGTSLITDAPVAGATTIATTLAGAATATFIASWPSGTTLGGTTSSGQILAGYRLQFLTGNRESATAPNNNIGAAGYENLSPEGEQMFLRAVALALNNGAVPVPEAGTSSLALAAGMLLLTRRRSRP